MVFTLTEEHFLNSAGENDQIACRCEHYRHLYEMGFNLIPKNPTDPKAAAKPWKRWQTERMPPDIFEDYLGYIRRRNVNMAIVKGEMPWHEAGIVVVDPDDADALKMVADRCPDTPVKTVTGEGEHWVYRHPRNSTVHNVVGVEIDGVEYDVCIKGDGGMVTAPGSVHVNGREYQEVTAWTTESLLAAPVYDKLWLPVATWDEDDGDPDARHERHINRSDLISMEERMKVAWARLCDQGGTTEGLGEASKVCYRLAIEMLWRYALSQRIATALMCRWGERDDQIDADGRWKPWSETEIRHKIEDALKQHRDHADEIIDWGRLEAQVEATVKPAPAMTDEPVSGNGKPDTKASLNKRKKTSQTQVLVGLASEKADLFHAPDDVAFATIQIGGHAENWGIRSPEFRRWMTGLYWSAKRDAPNEKALKSAVEILEHKAIQGPCHRVHLRVVRQGDNIYMDLGDPQWQAVEVGPDGWRVVADPPVKFRRTKNTGALPLPTRGGSLDDLRPLAATTDENWTLIKGWLLDALKGHGPYMVLVVTGEQGSAKSSLCRLMRSMVDPLRMAPLSGLPREEKDLGVDGTNEHLLVYDNVSYLPQWLSDCLCRVSTGGGIKSRMLYTDSQQSVFDICCPLCLNGIPDFAESNDLLGRSLIITQPSIPEDQRLDEKTLEAKFDSVKAGAFGAILDALSRGLRSLEQTDLPVLPRMADSAKWVTACLGDDGFLTAYQDNIESATDLGLEASPIAGAIKAYLTDDTTGNMPGYWEGTASELLGVINERVTSAQFALRTYPKNARAMSNRLRRDAPALRAVGIQVEFKRSGSARYVAFSPLGTA